MPLPDLGTVGPSVGTSLLVDADLYIDGVLVDPDFDSTYPAAGQVYTMPDAGWTQGLPGWSHILLNFGENQAFATGTLKKGEWELRIKLTVPQLAATVDSIKFWVL